MVGKLSFGRAKQAMVIYMAMSLDAVCVNQELKYTTIKNMHPLLGTGGQKNEL